MRINWPALCTIGFLAAAATPASSFLNLDFEDYNPKTGFLGGWHLFNPLIPRFNETNLPFIPPAFPIEVPYAGMVDAKGIATAPGFRAPGFEGNYALALYPAGPIWPWTLSQTAEVPSDARSLSFALAGSQFALRVNDQHVPLIHFYNDERARVGDLFATVYADISPFAGQNVQLEFTTSEGPKLFHTLDNISFSLLPAPQIPEPTILAFMILIPLTLFWTRKRRSR